MATFSECFNYWVLLVVPVVVPVKDPGVFGEAFVS